MKLKIINLAAFLVALTASATMLYLFTGPTETDILIYSVSMLVLLSVHFVLEHRRSKHVQALMVSWESSPDKLSHEFETIPTEAFGSFMFGGRYVHMRPDDYRRMNERQRLFFLEHEAGHLALEHPIMLAIVHAVNGSLALEYLLKIITRSPNGLVMVDYKFRMVATVCLLVGLIAVWWIPEASILVYIGFSAILNYVYRVFCERMASFYARKVMIGKGTW